MSIKSTSIVVILILAVACGGKKKPTAGEDAAPAPRVDPGPAHDAGSPGRKVSPRPSYSDEQTRQYRKRLAAGRKLAKAKKWGEAVVELEAALVAIPMDARALSELGWAAFQAGDYDKAAVANQDSLNAATEPVVKAASRYNLGRVAEAVGDKAAAARHYRASLKLRPGNDTVTERLAGLGKSPPRLPAIEVEDLPCVAPVAIGKLCACLSASEGRAMGESGAGGIDCRKEGGDVAGIKIVTLASENAEAFFVAGKSKAGWAVVARLGRTYNPGKFGISEEYRVAKIEPRELGNHHILWIEGHHVRADIDAVIGEEERRTQHVVTLCLVPAAADEAIHCPLQFPVIDDYQRVRSDDYHGDEVDDLATPGLPIERAVGLRVDLGRDGIVKLILVQGEKTDRIAPYLGPHKLWERP